MTPHARTPSADQLDRIRSELECWQRDGGPVQLHPGDLGWHALRGIEATAAATRVWTDDERLLAIALLDGADLLRFAIDPDLLDDDGLACWIAEDVDDAEAGVLPSGEAAIEARGATALAARLAAAGWSADELWTPLHRDLAAPVESPGVRIDAVAPAEAAEWVTVHWSAFRGTPAPAEHSDAIVEGWRSVATSPFGPSARILTARDAGQAVAVAAVWSAGIGRPGLIEPMGVHRDHRGLGHGVAITRAAAAALREMGSSSAIVCAESANVGAVSTYLGAGFTAHTEVADWRRGA